MKNKMFIHLGLPKTGSTSLQLCLYENRTLLEQYNFCYPIPDEFSYFSHQTLVPFFPRILNVNLNPDDMMQHLIRYIHARKKQDIILSSELFLTLSPHIFFDIFKNDYDIYLIIYIREFPSYYESFITQHIFNKCIFVPSIYENTNEYSNMYKLSFHWYTGKIHEWIENASLSHCIFKNYSDLSKKKILIKDFFDTINFQHYSELRFNPYINIGRGTCYAFFAYHLINLPINNNVWNDLTFNHIDTLSASDRESPRYRLMPMDFYKNPVPELLSYLKFYSKLLQDDDFIDRGIREISTWQQCPYTSLPVNDQHDIFNRLPLSARHTIIEAYPPAATKDVTQPILPPVADNTDFNSLLYSARTKYWDNVYQLQGEENKVKTMEAQITSLNEKIAHFSQKLNEEQARRAKIKASLSWKITAPLRKSFWRHKKNQNLSTSATPSFLC